MPERAIPVPEEDRRRQRDVLTSLRGAAGFKPAEAAAAIGVSVTQLGRYESGFTILPTPYYRTFARAYGITVAELTRRLGLLDDDWSFHDTLRGIVPEPLIAEQWEEIKNDPIKDQKAHAQEMLDSVERRRSEAMQPPQKQPRRSRPAPERTARGA